MMPEKEVHGRKEREAIWHADVLCHAALSYTFIPLRNWNNRYRLGYIVNSVILCMVVVYTFIQNIKGRAGVLNPVRTAGKIYEMTGDLYQISEFA